MELLSRDRILKVMSLTRYHFIAGLPRSGAMLLAALLQQNPRFVFGLDGRAQAVFSAMANQVATGGAIGALVDEDQRSALLRGTIDAVHHARPLDSVVFDVDIGWLDHLPTLVRLFPLSRVIVPVRDPAQILRGMARDAGEEGALDAIAAAALDPAGEIGAPMARLKAALSGPDSERLILVDYDRLVDDSGAALEILYEFIREPDFDHDPDNFRLVEPAPRGQEPRIKSGPIKARTRGPADAFDRKHAAAAFWRKTRRTDATLMI